MTRRRAPTIAAAAIACTVTLAACGVPTSDEPQALSRRDVPFGLLSPSTTQPADNTPGIARAVAQIYLLNGSHVAPVFRLVKAPATLQRSLDALQQPPTAPEAAAGLRTAISAQAQIQAPPPAGGQATIVLNTNFVQSSPQEQILAVAQLVYTATAFPGVTQVDFRLGGAPVQVPIGDGTLAERPLTRADFSAEAPA